MKRQGPAPEIAIRLFDEEWQRWDLTGASPRALPADAPPVNGDSQRTFAVPARQVLATPLWIEGADASTAPEAAKLELEVRGLLPRAQGMEGVSMRLLTEGTRTLAVAAVFPPELSDTVPAPEADRYDASPRLLDLAADTVTLWREGEDYVAAFTRGENVVYWETIDRSVGADEIRSWLQIITLRLQGEGVLAALPKVVSWIEGLPAERIAPSGSPTSAESVAAPPSFKSACFDWKPQSAVQAAVQRQQRERIRNIILGVAAFYVVIVAGLVIYAGIQHWRAGHIAAETARLRGEVDSFQPTMKQWAFVGPTADPSQYPIELLGAVISAMPADGIRLTKFDISEGKLTIDGEANAYTMASDFYDRLAAAPALKGITWENQNPSVESNTTTFHAVGTLPQQ